MKMTSNEFLSWFYKMALLPGDRPPTEFGAGLYEGKVLVHLPTLWEMVHDSFPREWDLGTWRDLGRTLKHLLPEPVIGPGHPLVAIGAAEHKRPASEFFAFDVHHAPWLAVTGLVRAPESVAAYDDHWLRQALWAFADADTMAAIQAGVFVQPDRAAVVIHWPTRAALHPCEGNKPRLTVDPAYAEKVRDWRVASRTPLQFSTQPLQHVKRRFDNNPFIRPALFTGRAARTGYAALSASPWHDRQAQCSVFDYVLFSEALKTYRPANPLHKHRVRFLDINLASLLRIHPHLNAHTEGMAKLENALGSSLRVYIRPASYKSWFLALAGCFNGFLGDTADLPSDVEAFYALNRAAQGNELTEGSFDIVDERVFLSSKGLLAALRLPVPHKEPLFALVALYEQLEQGMPLPRYRRDIKSIEERRFVVDGRVYTKRGEAWTYVEDEEIVSRFSANPDTGVRKHLTEDSWKALLAALPKRTRASIKARITTLNHQIMSQIKGQRGPHWKRYWHKARLGQPRGPVRLPKQSLSDPLRQNTEGNDAE